MSEQEHWESIYGRKAADALSWYRPHLDRSIALIEEAGLAKNAAIIDVGGGTSTLVDDLLDREYSNLTVLDISSTAIAAAKHRLGTRAARVTWMAADITDVVLPERRYEFWHDRAVFHFLSDPESRRRYVLAALRALKPGGRIVVATFGPHGPERCSGMEVVRYTADGLHGEFGSAFEKLHSYEELHRTPWGSEQEFVYCYCMLATG